MMTTGRMLALVNLHMAAWILLQVDDYLVAGLAFGLAFCLLAHWMGDDGQRKTPNRP